MLKNIRKEFYNKVAMVKADLCPMTQTLNDD